MTYTATITSKNQLTLPAALVKKINLKPGQKVNLTQEGSVIKIETYEAILDHLAGSVAVPSRFKGLSEDQILKKAKAEYFSKNQ